MSPSCQYREAAATAAKSLQSCATLWDPIDGSPPGSPVPGILQARTLEWVAISFSNVWKWKVKGNSLSCVRLLATQWTAAYQAPPSTGFSRQEYWSGVPLPSPRNTWSNRQIWPWNTEWSRARANRVLPREPTGHSKHPLPTTQEKALHVDITRYQHKNQTDYIICSQRWRNYTFSKNKTGSWLAQIMNSLLPNSELNWRK